LTERNGWHWHLLASPRRIGWHLVAGHLAAGWALLLLAVAPPPQAPAQRPPAPPPEIQKALDLAQKGNLAGAIALLEPAARKPDSRPGLRSLLGTLYLETGRPADAFALLGPLADGPQAGPVVYFNAARAALALNKDEVAEGYLERATKLAPDSTAARELGLLRGRLGKTEAAYALLLPWSRAHGDDVEVRLAAAYCAVELERPAEAQALLAGIAAGDPRAQLLRGRAKLAARDLQGALQMLDPLVASAPDPVQGQARRYAATAHLALGESAKTVALLEGKVGDDPSLAFLLARAQLQSADPAKAVATLEPFARALPPVESPPAERALAAAVALEYGRALVGANRFADALPALDKAARWAPEKAEAWQALGQAQMAAGKREEAAASLKKLQDLQKGAGKASQRLDEEEKERKDPVARTLREAAELAAQGKTDAALAKLRGEQALNPDDLRPRKAEIDTLLAAGRRDEAVAVLKKRLAAVPGDAQAAGRLKEIEKAPPPR
jgi:tetratricopeptide (TPR) repeat protein